MYICIYINVQIETAKCCKIEMNGPSMRHAFKVLICIEYI